MILSCTVTNATTYHVRESGDDTKDGKSWSNSFATIQKAFDLAKDGDEIWVAEGTYFPTKRIDPAIERSEVFDVRESISIFGGFPSTGNPNQTDRNWNSHKTIISGDIGVKSDTSDNTFHLFTKFDTTRNDFSFLIDGFYLSHSSYVGIYFWKVNSKVINCTMSDHDIAIYMYECTSEVLDCNFINNDACVGNYYGTMLLDNCTFNNLQINSWFGIIMNYYEGEMTLSNCHFENNKCLEECMGASISNYFSSNLEIFGCTFKNNSIPLLYNDLYYEHSKLTIKNSIFEDNVVIGGRVITSYSQLSISNSYFLNNSTYEGNGGCIYSHGLAKITNCTFTLNFASGNAGAIYNLGRAEIENSIFWDNVGLGGVNEIYSDSEYELLSFKNSCFPTGVNNIQGKYSSENSINENPKIYFMGTYPLMLSSNSPCIDKGNNDFLSEDFDVRGIGYPRKLNGNNNSAGIIDIGAIEFNKSKDTIKIQEQRRFFVKHDAIGKNDGSSWADAYTDLQSVLDLRINEEIEIWIAEGTYYPTKSIDSDPRKKSFIVNRFIEFYGGFKGNESKLEERNPKIYKSILSGDIGIKGDSSDNCFNIMQIFVSSNESKVVLDGLTFTGGNANGKNNFGTGGGILLKSTEVDISNCTFSDNHAGAGGAIHNQFGNLKIIDCSFTQNIAYSSGGALYLSNSKLFVSNCTFNLNIAGAGSAICNIYMDTTNILLCEFVKNESKNGTIYSGENSFSIIDDCKFRFNKSQRGAAIYISSSHAKINNCTFFQNESELFGTAIFLNNSNSEIDRCIFDGNYSKANNPFSGAAIYTVTGKPLIKNSSFKNNYGYFACDMYIASGAPAIINSLFVKTIDNTYGTIYVDNGKPEFLNCTIINDTTVTGPLLSIKTPSILKLTNSIIWSMDRDVNVINPKETGKLNLINSCIPMNIGNHLTGSPINCFSRYPNFLLTGEHPFALKSSSPCIDAGDNLIIDELYDIRGSKFQRKLNGKSVSPGVVDIGAYEYNFEFDDKPVTEKRTIYVSNAASGANTGKNWKDAYNDLQTALDSSDFGNDIWVAEGTYIPSKKITNQSDENKKAFSMKIETAIYGGFPASGNPLFSDRDPEKYLTILSGNKKYIVIHNAYIDETAVIDGFTISDGKNNTSGANGGGIINYYSNVNFRNCIVTKNSATYGSGIYNTYSSSIFTNCQIIDNQAVELGGGIVNLGGTPTFINCSINSNTSKAVGAIYNTNSKPVFINCKISNNSANSEAGGIKDVNSQSQYRNCIISENHTNGNGGNIFMQKSTSTFVDCEIYGATYASIVPGFQNEYLTTNSGDGFYILESNLSLKNCLLSKHCVMKNGSSIYSSKSNLSIINSTMVDNFAYTGGGIYLEGGKADISNSILWKNRMPSQNAKGREIFNNGGIVTIKNSCFNNDSTDIEGVITSIDCIHLDPQFRLRLEMPYSLSRYSPCIDAGNNELIDTENDIRGDGYPRKLNSNNMSVGTVDIGAYEYNSSIDPAKPLRNIIIYVSENAEGMNNGQNWDNAFTSFQTALDYSLEGDTIWVAEGTYKPSKLVSYSTTVPNYPMLNSRHFAFQMKNKTVIYGGFPNTGNPLLKDRDWQRYPTIFSGDVGNLYDKTDNCFNVFFHSAKLIDSTAVLDGFIIKHGNANSYSNQYYSNFGGGMVNLNCNPIIRNCSFIENSAGYGGAIYNGNHPSWVDTAEVFNPKIINCNFIENRADYGGSVYSDKNYFVLYEDCNFIYNNALEGGAIYNKSSANNFIDCNFISNKSTKNKLGGGAILNNEAITVIERSNFRDNRAMNGGGLYTLNGNCTVTNSVFFQNIAEIDSSRRGSGGAFYNEKSEITISNCSISKNKAAIGGGISNNATLLTVNNSIIWDNIADTNGNQLYIFNTPNTNVPKVNYSCLSNELNDVYGSPDYLNCIYDSPKFSIGNDYLLMIDKSSPCIDAGNNDYVKTAYDMRGNEFPRKLNANTGLPGQVDIGAYEFLFGIDNNANPEAVELFLPENNNTDISVTPMLEWQPKSNAISYQLQLSDNIGFVNMLVNQTDIKTIYYELKIKLSFMKNYYWRVRLKNQENIYGAWSEIWSFTTESGSLPTIPELSYPENDASDIPLNETLTWNSQGPNIHYQIQIALKNDFKTNFVYSEIYSNNWKGLLDKNIKYFWRVRAINSVGSSEWSDIRSFTTANTVSVEDKYIAKNDDIYFRYFENQFTIQVIKQDERILNIEVVNFIGQKLDIIDIITQDRFYHIMPGKLTSGVYFVRVTTNFQHRIFKIMIVE